MSHANLRVSAIAGLVAVAALASATVAAPLPPAHVGLSGTTSPRAASAARPGSRTPTRTHVPAPAPTLARAGAARIDGLASLRGPASRRGAASVGGPTSAAANQRLHGTVALDGSRFVRRVR